MFSSVIAPYIGGAFYDASPYYPFLLAIVITFFLAMIAFTRSFE